jgi:hypothetical protein
MNVAFVLPTHRTVSPLSFSALHVRVAVS